MRVRNITTCALGLAAALSLSSSVSAAQSTDTTRLRRPSDQRISISKGEVAPQVIRVDTVYVTRYDTVRVDNTIVRIDTVTVTQTVEVFAPKTRGLTYGLYGGLTNPIDNVDVIYRNSWHLGGMVGWEPVNRFLGLYLDGGVTKMTRENDVTISDANWGTGTPIVLHLGIDTKANVLKLGGFQTYAVAGINGFRYKNVSTVSDLDAATPPDDPCDYQVSDDDSCFVNATTAWRNKFGWNFGAGADFMFGGSSLFLETRFRALQANDERTWTMPITLGFRFR
jgi:hypothetical protein